MKYSFIVVCFVLYIELNSCGNVVQIPSGIRKIGESENQLIITGTKSVSSPPKFQEIADAASAVDISRRKGLLCMLGGALLHMTFGTLYCWGNFISYVPANLRFFDGLEHAGKQPDAVMVLPLTFIAQCCTMPFCPIVVKKFGVVKAALFGAWFMALGVYLSSYAKNLLTFIACYSLMFGSGVGLAYTAPMIAGWKWLPNSKGLVSGVVLMGYGLGGFIFNLVGTSFTNPKSLNVINGKFPEEVYSNFPVTLRKLAAIYVAFSIVGTSLLSEPVPVAEPLHSKTDTASKVIINNVEGPTGLSILNAISTPQFWLLWTMIACSASAGLNIASVYKRFALQFPALSGDQFQAMVGGIAAIFNGGGRVVWGVLSDRIGFKKSFILLTLFQAILQLLYPFSSTSRNAFLAMTCLSFFTLAGNFALAPPAVQRLFGAKNGAVIFGILFSSFGVASVGSMFLSKALLANFGWDGIFKALAALSLFASIITTALSPVPSFVGSKV